MPNYLVNALSELEARIPLIWTDSNIQFYDTQSKRMNWRVLIDEMIALQAPWVIIMAGTASPDAGGAVNAIDDVMPISIFYIRSDSPTEAEETANTRIEETVYQKLYDLQSDLFPSSPTVFQWLQVIDRPSIDVSPNNPANAVFIDASAPFTAGSLTINAVMGQTV